MMDHPAFAVSKGVICAVNQAASARMIVPGTAVASLICAGRKDYETFSGGCLYLSLTLSGAVCEASVTRLGDVDVFSIETEDDPELHAFSLAAQEMRLPLSQILSVTDQLFPTLTDHADASVADQLALVNRGLYRMLRLVGNMSDVATAGIGRTELVDLTAVVQEIFERLESLCREAGVLFTFTNHPAAVYTMADSQKLERAIFNLVSNALKYTAPGGEIIGKLARRGNTLYLSVTDSGTGNPGIPHMEQFRREPGISDGKSGLGLGLTLVRAVAAVHQGTVLIDQIPSGGTRVTISLPIIQDTQTLRSPGVRIDYAGERDHGLIELSESLPPKCFLPKKL